MAIQRRLNPSFAMVPETVECLVSFTDLAPATTVNRQILGSNVSVTGSAGLGKQAFLGSDATLKPTRFSQPFLVFAQPNGGAAAAATNSAPLPIGLQAVAPPTNGEYVVCVQGFAGDITGAQAALCQNTRGAATRTAYVSAIDNVNKLVYVQVVTIATNAVVAAAATDLITVDIQIVENGFTA